MTFDESKLGIDMAGVADQEKEVVAEKQITENEPEKMEILGASKDANFEGSTIIKTQDAEGRVVGYAIRQKEDGSLEGNEIRYQSDGSVGVVYQLHEADFAKLKQNGTLDSYEGALMVEKSKNIDDAKLAMLRMYMQGDKINPWQGQYPDSSLMVPAEEALNSLSSEDQERMATDFFNDTIGRDISNNRNAYSVYGMFKSTPFGQKFKQLEDARLKAAGYNGFIL